MRLGPCVLYHPVSCLYSPPVPVRIRIYVGSVGGKPDVPLMWQQFTVVVVSFLSPLLLSSCDDHRIPACLPLSPPMTTDSEMRPRLLATYCDGINYRIRVLARYQVFDIHVFKRSHYVCRKKFPVHHHYRSDAGSRILHKTDDFTHKIGNISK